MTLAVYWTFFNKDCRQRIKNGFELRAHDYDSRTDERDMVWPGRFHAHFLPVAYFHGIE